VPHCYIPYEDSYEFGDVMDRGKTPNRPNVAVPAVPGVPRLTLEEARKALHDLARRFSELKRPSDSLVGNAVAVGAHRKPALLMIPEVDVLATLEELEEQRRELEELEDDLEVFGMLLLAQERLTEPTTVEDLIPVEDLARRFGVEELLDA
jgi:hypothetical protein